MTRAAEHDGRAHRLDGVGCRRRSVRRRERPEQVARDWRGPGRLHRPGGRPDRAALRRQGGDGAVERGAEQQHLALATGALEDATDRREEPHVGHAIRLVDDDRGDIVELDDTGRQQVLETAGAGDDQLGAALEGAALRPVPDPAVDGDELMTAPANQRPKRSGDLTGQLTRRHEHQGSRAAACGGGQPGDERDTERQRLAGASRGATADVTPSERVGDHGGLDGGGIDDAGPREDGAEIIGHAERGETVVGHGHVGKQLPVGQQRNRPEQRSVCAPARHRQLATGYRGRTPLRRVKPLRDSRSRYADVLLDPAPIHLVGMARRCLFRA